MIDFKGKKIAILGAGAEGIASEQFLRSQGAEVTLLDEATDSHAFADLRPYDLIIRSPGVKLSHTVLKDIPKEKITSQTRIFFDLCPCPLIGVTGTKGKGTTSSLIYEMLKKAGFDAYLGGNIGIPPFTFLDKLTAQSRVVLELSSFQLQDVTKSPHIAVFLMVTSDHLDYHKDEYEYIDAKRNILRFQERDDFAVINRDYPASNESDIYTQGKVFQVSRERTSTEQGCFVKEGAVWISMQGREWKVINTSEIKLPGKHNLENVCAAVMAATLAGASKEDIVSVLKTFNGLEHRLELVGEVNGVRFYDDSFSTTPETAIAAIEAFSVPEILILGGSRKESDFRELGTVISKADNIKAIIGIGEEWPRIREQIAKSGKQMVLIEGAKDMHTIVQAAVKIAVPGDVVLLSPACASFGMFKNYKERGDQFKKEVASLS